MATKDYQITSVDDIKYKTLLYTECNIGKRFIYVYMLEEHLEKYLETGKSKFKIGQTDVRVGNRINDQIYHHGWQTITSSAPIIIAIYEVDNNITDKIIHSKICADVKNASISKFDERKSYHHAKSGTEWVNNISINDIENTISYYQGKFLFINNDALTNNYNITCNVEQSKYEFVNMLNNLVNSYDIAKDRNIIKRYIQGIVISSIILGSDYKKCNILFGHKSFINIIEKLFNITFNDFMNKISYYERNYSDIDQMISMIHDYAMDNDLDLSWIAECFIDFTNGDSTFATNWKRMAAYYYADYLQEYIDKMDFDCKKNKDIKFLIYPGSLAILDMIAEYRKIAIGNYNRKSEKIRYIVENEITLAFDFNDDFISDFVKQIIYYKYNVKLDNIIYITENSEIYNNNKKELIDMPKFDYIVQNPPYSGTTYLKFIDLGYDMLNDNGQMISITPATVLINIDNVYKNGKDFINFLKYEKTIKSITFENLNREFRTETHFPFAIIHFDKNKINNDIIFKPFGAEYKINSLYDANMVGDYNIIKSILNKLKNFDKLSNHIYEPVKNNIISGNYYIGFSSYLSSSGCSMSSPHNGQNFKSNTYYINDIPERYYNQLYRKNYNGLSDVPHKRLARGSGKPTEHDDSCITGTFNELNNYLHYINNKLPLFINILFTIDVHEKTHKYIPWFVNKKYTDDEIYKLCNFTETEINFINKTIKKFSRYSPYFERYCDGQINITNNMVQNYLNNL